VGVPGVGGVLRSGIAGVGGVATVGVDRVSGAAMPPVAVFDCVTGPVTAPGLSTMTWTLTFTGPACAVPPAPEASLVGAPGVMTT
jgi:hypothetical protein